MTSQEENDVQGIEMLSKSSVKAIRDAIDEARRERRALDVRT